MKSSFSKRAVAVVLSVMMVFSMIPMMAFSASAEITDGTVKLITSEDELRQAALDGGTYTLGKFIDVSSPIVVKNDLIIDGYNSTYDMTYSIDANYAYDYEGTQILFMLGDPTKTLTLSNMTLYGSYYAAHAISANQVVANEGNVITLNNCKVYGFVGSSYVGAVYAYSRATVNLNNCEFYDNTTQERYTTYCSGADVWAGAAATLNIDGGIYEEIFANANAGSGAKVNITNNAYVGELVLEDDGKKAEATIDESSDVSITSLVDSEEKLIEAAATGGYCIITKDITLTKRIDITKGLDITGEGNPTITGNIPDEAYGNGGKAMFMLNQGNTDIWFNLQNVTLDGANKTPIAISTEGDRTIDNSGTCVTLNECTVKNFVGYSYIGAVYVYSKAELRANSCTFTGNTTQLPDNPASGADIWAGAASTVSIGGYSNSFDEIFCNANKSGGANIDIGPDTTIKELALEKDGKEATAIVDRSAYVENITLGGNNINHYVAIGEKGYDTLEEALAAAKDGDVITCNKVNQYIIDKYTNLNEYVVETDKVTTDKSVTLDGFTFVGTDKTRNAFLLMTGKDVAVKNCTFSGTIYNAIETVQNGTLNSLTVDNCTFNSDAANNNHINCFSFDDGATVTITNNKFNCKSASEAIRISNYTNAENVTYTIDNNTYNAEGNGEYDTFIMFEAVKGEKFDKVDVNITNLTNTNDRPIYFVYDDKKGNTTVSEKTDITLDGNVVDYREVQAQVVLADGMVGIKVVGDNVTIDGTAVENGTLYLTPAQAANFYKTYTIVADGVTGTFTMNGYINALTDEKAKAALRAFEVYGKAASNVFDNNSYQVTSTYDFSTVDATPVKDDIFCGVSIDCSSKTQLIVYADDVAAGTAVKVNGADTEIVTVDCGSKSHTAIVVPVNSINTPVTIEVDGKTITYSVKQASKLLSGVSGYEVLAAALANYGDALAAYTA